MTSKQRKYVGAVCNSIKVKYKNKDARERRKRELKDRDKPIEEKEIRKHDMVSYNGDGTIKEVVRREQLKFGVFRKGGWKACMLTTSREKAQDYIEKCQYPQLYEVREIIDYGE